MLWTQNSALPGWLLTFALFGAEPHRRRIDETTVLSKGCRP
jgi:hypothetical protein